MHADLNPETLISEIPAKILYQLANYLDVPDGTTRPYWKALIGVIPEDLYTDIQINKFSMCLHQPGGSPALSLLRDLGNLKGRTVKQVATYLHRLHYEEALKLIKSPEQLTIIHHPESASVLAGESSVAKFACQAKGFPYPRYQWFRARTTRPDGKDVEYSEVENASDRILEISPLSLEDAGGYCCKVYHTVYGQEQAQFTEWAYLTVIPPQPSPSNDETTGPSGQVWARPIIVEHPSPISVDVGKELRLSCRATGCPKPNYQWYKYPFVSQDNTSGKEMLKGYNSEVLQFAQASKSDTGEYVCHVYNSVGEEWSHSVSVTVDTLRQVTRICKIEILRQPKDVMCLPGVPQTLECLASCPQQLYYQWIKDDEELEGQKSPQICFEEVKMSDSGTYWCRVMTAGGQTELSAKARLQVPSLRDKKRFKAVDKVALLIGNQDYRSAVQLMAPESDMYSLSCKLCEMNFKVVSLLNLTLGEMRKALNIFCSLLNEGVYGLFYFSGHGFENDGQSYLVPSDAASGYSTQECMCAQEVLDQMQQQNTALNVLLLDICRKYNDNDQDRARQYRPEVKGNTVFGYAAQCNSEAFEVKSRRYAIFTKYLVRRISEDTKISILLDQIMEDVKNDPDAGDRQFPAVRADLNEHRTLVDEVSYRGHTEEFSARGNAWTKAHELPIDQWARLKYGITIYITYECIFSNVMLINAYLWDKGATTDCRVHLEMFPVELDISVQDKDTVVETSDGHMRKLYGSQTKVQNIQKLRDDLNVYLVVIYDYNGMREEDRRVIQIVRPLISKVWLLDMPERAPTEDECPDSTSNSLIG